MIYCTSRNTPSRAEADAKIDQTCVVMVVAYALVTKGGHQQKETPTIDLFSYQGQKGCQVLVGFSALSVHS